MCYQYHIDLIWSATFDEWRANDSSVTAGQTRLRRVLGCRGSILRRQLLNAWRKWDWCIRERREHASRRALLFGFATPARQPHWIGVLGRQSDGRCRQIYKHASVVMSANSAYTRILFLRTGIASYSVGAHSAFVHETNVDSDDDDDETTNASGEEVAEAQTADDPQQNDVCQVCLVAPRDALLAVVPCGHQRFCPSCIEQVKQQQLRCSLCRTENQWSTTNFVKEKFWLGEFWLSILASLAFSTPVFWCHDFHSRVFQTCFVVPRIPLPPFPLLHFWHSRVFHSRVFSRPAPYLALWCVVNGPPTHIVGGPN